MSEYNQNPSGEMLFEHFLQDDLNTEIAPFGDPILQLEPDAGSALLGLVAEPDVLDTTGSESQLAPEPELIQVETFASVVVGMMDETDPLLTAEERVNPFAGLEGVSVKAKEVDAIRDLTHTSFATAIAMRDGSFFDPATFGGAAPRDGDRVIIPEGITVTYDSADNVPRLDTLRVDGTLEFATDRDTELIVDLFVIEEGGTLRIGTAANPISPEAEARVTFASADANDSAIDLARDPLQVSRGLVALPGSTTDVHGSDRTDYTTLASGGTQAGDRELRFAALPGDWQIGDRLVLTGTNYDSRGSNEDNSRFQDEELTITGIDRANNTITFEQRDIGGDRLRFDRQAPEGFELDVYVANLTRNVVFASAEGEATPLAERGYTLFLDQDLRLFNAGFDHLGRFNNDILVNNPVLNADGTLQAGTGTNRNGRIPVYVADTLVTGSYEDAAAVISGNAVNGSASWAFGAATSRVTFEDNVSFDVVGAHFVTRDGDEIAIFRDNIAIKATGAQTDPAADLQILDRNERGRLRDLAVRGFGFWFDSSYSATEVTGNIAVSTEDTGFLFYGTNDNEATEARKGEQLTTPSPGLVEVPVASLSSELQAIAGDREFIPAHLVPNVEGSISGNTVYNAESGFEVRGILRNDRGDFREAERLGFGPEELGDARFILDDFTIFGVREFGAQPGLYTAAVTLQNSLILGDLETPIARNSFTLSGGPIGHGIVADQNSRGIVLINNRVEGFEVGIELHGTGSNSLQLADELDPTDLLGGVRVIGATLANNTFNFGAVDGRTGEGGTFARITDNAPFNPLIEIRGDLNIETPTENLAPVARLQVDSGEGLTVNFDGTGSFDLDYAVNTLDGQVDNDNSIASFAYDFESDGIIDAFGSQATFAYDAPGTYAVTLTVIDNQGATSTEILEITLDGAGQLTSTVLQSDPIPELPPEPEPEPTPTEPVSLALSLSATHLGFFNQPLGIQRESTFSLASLPELGLNLSFEAAGVHVITEAELLVNGQPVQLPGAVLRQDDGSNSLVDVAIAPELLAIGNNTLTVTFADNRDGQDNGFFFTDLVLTPLEASIAPEPEPTPIAPELSATHLGFFNQPLGTQRESLFDLASIPDGGLSLSFTASGVHTLAEAELYVNDRQVSLPTEVVQIGAEAPDVTLEIDASLLMTGENMLRVIFADDRDGLDNGFFFTDLALALLVA